MILIRPLLFIFSCVSKFIVIEKAWRYQYFYLLTSFLLSCYFFYNLIDENHLLLSLCLSCESPRNCYFQDCLRCLLSFHMFFLFDFALVTVFFDFFMSKDILLLNFLIRLQLCWKYLVKFGFQ